MTKLSEARHVLSLKKMAMRMIGAAKFSGETFGELRDDRSSTAQSVFIVPLVGLCYGAGLGLFGYLAAGFSLAETFLITLVGIATAGIIAFLWSGTTFLIVTKLFHRTIDYWGLTRPLLFSWAPGLLYIFLSSPNPNVSDVFRIAVTAWIGIASIFAVKHAAGFSVQQSMMIFVMSALVLVLVQLVLGSVLTLFLS